MTLNILHVISSLNPATGGPPAVLMRLASGQAALGHSVRTISYGSPDANRWLADATRDVPFADRVRHAFLPLLTRPERVAPRSAKRALPECVRDADVVHIHGVWDHIVRVAANTARRAKVPYVITPHCMLNTWSLGQSAWKKRLALMLGYRRMLNDAALLQALNADEARMISAMGLQARTVIIPNGIYESEMHAVTTGDEFANAYRGLDGQPYVVFLGRLHLQKGVDVLVDAFAQLRSNGRRCKLVLIGPDYGLLAALQKKIAHYHLSQDVILTGPVFGRLKLSALAGAACFCLPSRQEGFSMAILEAMAVGVPVVISEGCNFPEVAEAGAGIVTQLDASKIADGLEYVLADAPRAALMGTHGRALVQSRYTWPKIAEQMLSAYASITPRQ